jgi:hypothetical protein
MTLVVSFIGARPGLGCTSLACAYAMRLLDQGHACLIIDLDLQGYGPSALMRFNDARNGVNTLGRRNWRELELLYQTVEIRQRRLDILPSGWRSRHAFKAAERINGPIGIDFVSGVISTLREQLPETTIIIDGLSGITHCSYFVATKLSDVLVSLHPHADFSNLVPLAPLPGLVPVIGIAPYVKGDADLDQLQHQAVQTFHRRAFFLPYDLVLARVSDVFLDSNKIENENTLSAYLEVLQAIDTETTLVSTLAP